MVNEIDAILLAQGWLHLILELEKIIKNCKSKQEVLWQGFGLKWRYFLFKMCECQ